MSLPARPRCFITGSGGGLGREFARQLARDNHARLWLCDLDRKRAEDTAKLALEAGATEANVLDCDVRDEAAVRAAAAEIERAGGGIDLVINNAGVAAVGDFSEIPSEDWRWSVDTNLYGVLYGCQAFLPIMKKQGRGHLLNIASAAGLLCAPKMGPYNVTKAAVIALSETLRAELEDAKIGVTVACPMFFPTSIASNGRISDKTLASLASRMVGSYSKVTAADVARSCLSAVEANRFYVLPTFDSKAFWTLKRAMPDGFRFVTTRVLKHMLTRQAAKSK